MRYFLTFTFIAICFLSFSQGRYKPKKLSFAKRTIFGSWGYNRAMYTGSKLHLEGDGFDFNLRKLKAKDQPVPFSSQKYFSSGKLFVPQYSLSIGYYIENHWAVALEVHQFNYIMQHGNEMTLDGFTSKHHDVNLGGEAPVSSGNHSELPVTTSPDQFHFEYKSGLSLYALSLIRTDRLVSFGANDQLAFSSNIRGSFGLVHTVTNSTFANKKSYSVASVSGFGVKGAFGLRMEFFRYLFLQSNFSLGYVNMPNVKFQTPGYDYKAMAQHHVAYMGLDFSLGLLMYLREVNGCDSCPKW